MRLHPALPSVPPAFVAALLMVATTVYADWPHDPNNGNVLISPAAQANAPHLIYDGAGGAIISWDDARTTDHVYAQRVSAAGVPMWGTNGVAMCLASGTQFNATLTSDGAGGAIVTWTDQRHGQDDVYAQHVDASGVLRWAPNGDSLCLAPGNQFFPVIASDGAGGAIVTWYDDRGTSDDIYAQRVSAAGAPLWNVDGDSLCAFAGSQSNPAIVADGSGGAIVTWQDTRSVTSHVFGIRVTAAGTIGTGWPVGGAAICTAGGGQTLPTITSDGAGGAIVAWQDFRNGTDNDIYAQRINGSGQTVWQINGDSLCTFAGSQFNAAIASDGAGGAIVAWQDGRSGASHIYAQRIDAAGVPQWGPGGLAVCLAAGAQSTPTIVADGTGGAIVGWYDSRYGNNDIFAQRLSATGAVLWTTDGVPISTAVRSQDFPAIASDGADGAIIAWRDGRLGSNCIAAQRVERFGQLGNPGATITSALDVPNDQGGRIKLVWSPSYLDADPVYGIGAYWVWRSVPPNLMARAVEDGAQLVLGAGELPRPGTRMFMSRRFGAQTYAWEYVGSQAARGFPSYSMVVATTADSVAGSNPLTAFLVEANAATTTAFWNSAPDSGYSVDNLAPATPAPFVAAYVSGATHLHWGANTEPDLAGYRLYRGGSVNFIPGPGNLVAASGDTGYVDAGPAGSFYKLSAIDVHGNESAFALVTPGGTSSVSPSAPRELTLSLASPNPGRGGAEFRYTLPRAAPMELVIYDLAGRRVRVLSHGALAAGAYTTDWDGRDPWGHDMGGGLYLARLTTEGRTLVQRVVLLR